MADVSVHPDAAQTGTGRSDMLEDLETIQGAHDAWVDAFIEKYHGQQDIPVEPYAWVERQAFRSPAPEA